MNRRLLLIKCCKQDHRVVLHLKKRLILGGLAQEWDDLQHLVLQADRLTDNTDEISWCPLIGNFKLNPFMIK